jgi:hypothetical protein
VGITVLSWVVVTCWVCRSVDTVSYHLICPKGWTLCDTAFFASSQGVLFAAKSKNVPVSAAGAAKA